MYLSFLYLQSLSRRKYFILHFSKERNKQHQTFLTIMVSANPEQDAICEANPNISSPLSGSVDLAMKASGADSSTAAEESLEISDRNDKDIQRSPSPTPSNSFHENEEEVSGILTDLFLANLGDLTQTRKLTLVKVGSKYHDSCGDYHTVHNPFPVTALSTILQQAKALVCLELCHLRLSGCYEEFVELAHTIETHCSALLAFSMEYCCLNKQAAKENAMEPVVRALASSPRIGDVTLIASSKHSMGTLSSDLVGFLGRSPSLRALRLHKMALRDKQVKALCKAMEQNHTMTILKFSCTIVEEGSSAIARMIERNSALDKIDLFLDKVVNEDCSVQIAFALQSSTTLKTYELDFGNKNMSSRLKEVYKDLVEHKALAHELQWSTSATSRCPFLRMMQTVMGGCVPGNGNTNKSNSNSNSNIDRNENENGNGNSKYQEQ